MKERARTHWRMKRREISNTRRSEANAAALDALPKIVENHRYVLSFASYNHEFSTTAINQHLADQKKLLLPKIEGDHLKIFHVEDPKTQLTASNWGAPEPIPELCELADLSEISLVLVPGLAFDAIYHRVGYGKGYYDRFLPQLSPSCEAYGLGFKEQLTDTPLPTNDRDIVLSGLLLF